MTQNTRADWAIKLFEKSILKQQKYQQITDLLGSTDGLHCLDIGSDNGVISYLLRQRGGSWKSADLTPEVVEAIRGLVESDVYQINGERTPFADDAFDCVVIIDFLEHIPNDAAFIQELHRILKPGGALIINVPHIKPSLLRRLRIMLGQTDEKHGHLRPGYTDAMLRNLLGDAFKIETSHTYSKFFIEFIDTVMVAALNALKREPTPETSKGVVVTDSDLNKFKKMFRLYSLIYPVVWLFSKLDALLFFRSGYMLILKARVVPINEKTEARENSYA